MLIVLVLVAVLIPVAYVRINKILYAHRVENYLIKELHYSKQEIASVKGVWGIKLPSFFAVVRFRDEPEVEYTYFAHNEVIQFSHEISEKGLDQGIRESDLKHFVPLNPY